MYGLIRDGLNGISLKGNAQRKPLLPSVGATVIYLGLTSLFTDISSEMVSAILPIYLIFQQQASVLQFGIVDGIYQGGSAIFRVMTGVVADRMGRQKELAASGYALSMLARVGMVLMAGPATIGAFLLVDRFGKGIRTAPRDAMISLSVAPEDLGTAFGVHRTLDTIGAMLGPLVAFGLLILVPMGFNVVFIVSLCVAVIGLAFIVFMVEGPRVHAETPGERTTLREAVALLRAPTVRGLMLAGAVLSLFTVSDSFVYLTLQRNTGIPLSIFPLFFVGTSVSYLLLAVPLGRLSDSIGRVPTTLPLSTAPARVASIRPRSFTTNFLSRRTSAPV